MYFLDFGIQLLTQNPSFHVALFPNTYASSQRLSHCIFSNKSNSASVNSQPNNAVSSRCTSILLRPCSTGWHRHRSALPPRRETFSGTPQQGITSEILRCARLFGCLSVVEIIVPSQFCYGRSKASVCNLKSALNEIHLLIFP